MGNARSVLGSLPPSKDSRNDTPSLTELESAVRCPIKWRSIPPLAQLDSAVLALELGWLQHFAKYARDLPEVNFLELTLLKREDRLDCIRGQERAVLANVRDIYPLADADYRKTLGRLSNVVFLDPASDQGGKHFKPGLSEVHAVLASAKGPSLFFNNPGGDRIRDWFWYWFANVFHPNLENDLSSGSLFLSDDSTASEKDTLTDMIWSAFGQENCNLRVLFPIFGPSLGASNGAAVNDIIFDILLRGNGGQVHAYPGPIGTEGSNVHLIGYIDG